MKFTSTRDTSVSTDGADAVVKVISADGGLFVPTEFPKLDLQSLVKLDYVGRAETILSAFFDFDISGIADVYNSFDDDPAPVVKLDRNMFFLELWHGRTHAHKDMALALLPQTTVRAKASKNDNTSTLAIVATGGNTGKAALEWFSGVAGVKACVFYPTKGINAESMRAMQIQSGDNVCAVGVNGNMDDVLRAVKGAFTDVGLRQTLAADNISLMSVSSANICRLVAQIVYYFSAYCDLVDAGEIKLGEKIDFVAPTDSFGSVLPGYYAYRMGLPVNKLVCAVVPDGVVADFVDTGVCDINREVFVTDEPAMDLPTVANLERIIFETSGRDGELTSRRMKELETMRRYSVTPEEIESIRELIAADCVDGDEIEDAIAEIFDEYGYIVDPRTAMAYIVAARREFIRPTVILSTVSPYRAVAAVLDALGEQTNGNMSDMFDLLESVTAMEKPQSLAEVFTAPIRFDTIINPSEVKEYIITHYSKHSNSN